MFEDKKGVFILAQMDQGLSIYNKYTETFTNYKSGLSSKTLSNNSIRDIIDLSANELLIATDEGLNIFNKTSKQFSIVKTENDESADNLTYIFKDPKIKIYVGQMVMVFLNIMLKKNT